MMPRSQMLPLLAVLALGLGQGSVVNAAGEKPVEEVVEPTPSSNVKGSTKARFGFLNALGGNTALNVYIDGKQFAKNQKPGKAAKPKTINAEGYSIYVGDAKQNLGFLDFPYTFIAGRDYLLVAMLDSYSAWYSPVMVDTPSLIVPKDAAHVVWVSALYDGVPLDVVVNGAVMSEDLPHKGHTMPAALIANDATVEFQIDGVTVAGPFKTKLKGGQTTTFVLTGTLSPDDNVPVKLMATTSKSQ